MAATTFTVNIGYDQQVALVQEKMSPQHLSALRVAFWKATADGAGTVAARAVVTLPAGSLVILPQFCGAYIADTDASATFSMGYAAHVDEAGTTVNADIDAFIKDVVVGAGPTAINGFASLTGTTIISQPGTPITDVTAPILLNSQSGINVTITVAVADANAGDVFFGWIGFLGGTPN